MEYLFLFFIYFLVHSILVVFIIDQFLGYRGADLGRKQMIGLISLLD